jgi:hypothetical protein
MNARQKKKKAWYCQTNTSLTHTDPEKDKRSSHLSSLCTKILAVVNNEVSQVEIFIYNTTTVFSTQNFTKNSFKN